MDFQKNKSEVPSVISDRGLVRNLNEDRYAVISHGSSQTWVVCDGMGGSQGGELAAQLAVDSIKRSLETGTDIDLKKLLISSITEANRSIVLRRQNPQFVNMGTTIVAVGHDGDEYVFASAGDSRAYLIRGEGIQQLTKDHTYVQQLVDEGKIKPSDSLKHPQAHVLTRCLGAKPDLDLDLVTLWRWQEKTEENDFILLCTDGLYSMVSDDEICLTVSTFEPHEACMRLTELAKNRGGYDNITVAVIPVDGQIRREPPPKRRKKKSSKAPIKNKLKLKSKKRKVPVFVELIGMSLCGLLGVLGTILYFYMKYSAKF